MNPASVLESDGYRLLAWTVIGEHQRPTGQTIHLVFGRRTGPAAGLAICTFDLDDGFYLFSCDKDWNVMSDTYHATFEEAQAQAAREYEGIETWQRAV